MIAPGEHPFVQHDTYAVYADARRTTAERLRQALRDRGAIPREPVSAALLERSPALALHARRHPGDGRRGVRRDEAP